MNKNNYGRSYLEELTVEKIFSSKRVSSWNRSGKNMDFINLSANEKKILVDIKGPGCIKHIYFTSLFLDPFFYRNVILKIFWDGEDSPSVEVPLGDFFGIGHCKPKLFNSLVLSVNPGNPLPGYLLYTYGVNCYFLMPFAEYAKVEIENQSDIPIESFWYHVDYQEYEKLDDNIYRFHASWNREITKVEGKAAKFKNDQCYREGVNLTGEENYIILDTQGNGQLIGILLNVDNIAGNWWGEGDDMVFIDGESWPPSLHGTGTEEIFGGGACPAKEYCTPYCGFHLVSNSNWYRQNSMYRFFIVDPIRFKKSIKYTIEHGHANNFENDYSSVAYWYQIEPHKKLSILPAKDRIPLLHSAGEKEVIKKQLEVVKAIYRKVDRIFGNITPNQFMSFLAKLGSAENAYFKAKYDHALNEWCQIEKIIVNL